MRRSLFTLLRKFKRSQSGVTAIEFAFVAPAFLFVFFSLLEVSLMLFTQDSINAAMNQVSRQMRTGQAQEAEMSQESFKSEICNKLSSMIKCDDLKVTSVTATDFATLKSNLPLPGSVGTALGKDGKPKPIPYTCGNPYDAVGVVAVYDWKFVTPFIGRIYGDNGSDGTRRIYAVTVFRNEPFPSGTKNCPNI